MSSLELRLQSLGLRKVGELIEVLYANTFLLDADHNTDDGMLRVYPVTRKANLSHGTLNLYGTHWRYLIIRDQLVHVDGDRETVLRSAREKRSEHRFACYSWTKRMLESTPLWLFQPGTPGWDYYQNSVLPRYLEDHRKYLEMRGRTNKISHESIISSSLSTAISMP